MAEPFDDPIGVSGRRGPVFLRAWSGALGRVPAWLLTWLVPLLAAAVLSFAFVDWFEKATAHRYAPGSLLGTLDEAFRQDHRLALESLRSGAARAAAPLLFLMMLWSAFAAGGWLQVFLQKTRGHSLRRFLWGGAAHFWRFARVWVLGMLLFSLATWLAFGWPWKLVLHVLFGLDGGNLDGLTSERTVVWIDWVQTGLYSVLFSLVLVWGDYTRTRLALQDARSALWAGICTVFLLLRHPLRTLRPFVLVLAVEVLLVWGLGHLSWGWSKGLDAGAGTGGWRLLAIFLVGQLAMIAQAVARGARYHAAVEVSRILVPPSVRPDPWAKRVGGPGGPQYPIDDADDYGVSI